MMNSNELMNRAWQYDIVGMLMFVLSNTSSTDFGRVFFMIFGVAMIITSLFVMLAAYKREVREEEARNKIVKEIAEMLLADKKPKKASKKTSQKTAKGSSTNKVGKYIKTKNKTA